MNQNDPNIEKLKSLKMKLKAQVTQILEDEYHLNPNTAQKTVEVYFARDFLPDFYFISHHSREIADHIFIINNFLNANTEHITHQSENGNVITYFVNVGRDFPGKLLKILEDNIHMNIVSFKSVITQSGIRIVTLQKKGEIWLAAAFDQKKEINQIKQDIRSRQSQYVEDFIDSLPNNYFNMDVDNERLRNRVDRHLMMFEKAMDNQSINVNEFEIKSCLEKKEHEDKEKLLCVSVYEPDIQFPLEVIRLFEIHNVNIHRSYLDTFVHQKTGKTIAILSIYTFDCSQFKDIIDELSSIWIAQKRVEKNINTIDKQLEEIIRTISQKNISLTQIETQLFKLKELIQENKDLSTDVEIHNFLLNAISDWWEAAKFIGLEQNYKILQWLLGFSSIQEFFISATVGNKKVHLPGFRFAHGFARGANKGGLRIDPIVQFVEVAALSFMMNWKNAKSRILFNGGKGGLILNPKDYSEENKLDFIDTLTNFGRSLFLVTGPVLDVPAGDVGCGAEEISILVEGFKSALRDLALVVYGIRESYTMIGNRVLSLADARKMLLKHFNIHPNDTLLLNELVKNETYLNLVVAAQITGKPLEKMGTLARTGATGRGLCYSILAMVLKKYLNNTWKPIVPLTKQEHNLLQNIALINEKHIQEKNGQDLISDNEWEILNTTIFPKLFRDKKVVVQGKGKVGESILRNLKPFGINLIGIADSRGAIIGDHLDIDELFKELSSLKKSRQSYVTNLSLTGIQERIEGDLNGAKAIFALDSDLLLPCALENAITAPIARNIKTKLIACGGNGTNTSKAEQLLHNNNISVVYDFLANSGGVIASYFEWLENLYERFQYEARYIYEIRFDASVMDPYLMPEFKERLKSILTLKNKDEQKLSNEWNKLMRDIIFAGLTDDFDFADQHNLSLKTAGFVNAILRVLCSMLLSVSDEERTQFWDTLSQRSRDLIKPYFSHPEAQLINPNAQNIWEALYSE